MNKLTLSTLIVITALLFGLFIGFIVGVQTTFDNIATAGETIFKGTTWNIDINETEIVSAVNNTLFPQANWIHKDTNLYVNGEGCWINQTNCNCKDYCFGKELTK